MLSCLVCWFYFSILLPCKISCDNYVQIFSFVLILFVLPSDGQSCHVRWNCGLRQVLKTSSEGNWWHLWWCFSMMEVIIFYAFFIPISLNMSKLSSFVLLLWYESQRDTLHRVHNFVSPLWETKSLELFQWLYNLIPFVNQVLSMSRLGGAGAVAPLVTDIPLSSVEVKLLYLKRIEIDTRPLIL